MFKPEGIIAAMVTAFHEDETLNLAEIRNQVNRHLKANANAVFCLGTNGEAYIQSDEEKQTVIETVVREAAGRIPVYAGTGMPGTEQTIRLSRMAREAGANVLSIISPYFAAISQDEIYEHYRKVAEAVNDMPIVMYNMPARTGNNIAPATVAELSKIDNIVGIKDSSGNFDNMLQYIEQTDQAFSVLSGNDSLILWNLLAGGCGGITAVANIYPHTMVSIYQHFIKGDVEAARTAQNSIRPIRSCFKFGNPNTVTKKATNLIGQPVGPCRAPFNRLSDTAVEAIRKTVEADVARGMN